MEQFLIYLWILLTNTKETISIFINILIGLTLFVLLFRAIAFICAFTEEEKKTIIKTSNIVLIITFISIIINILIPTKEQIALIFLYPTIKNTTIKTIQSKEFQKINNILNLYLDKQIKELK